MMTVKTIVMAMEVMRNTGLDEVQPESRFLWKISITSDMQMIPLLWQKVKKN